MRSKDKIQPKDTTPASEITLNIARGYFFGLISRVLPQAVKPALTLMNWDRPTEQEATEALKKLREIGDMLDLDK